MPRRVAISPNSVFGPGRCHDRRRHSADDRRAEEDEIRRIRSRRSMRLVGTRHLVRRERFARQHRLLNREVARVQQTCIRGHEIPGRQPHDISRDDLSERDLLPGAVTEHGGGRRHRRTQSFGRPLRTIRLPEIDAHAQQDDRDDDPRIDVFAEPAGHRARDEEYEDQRIGEQPPDLDQGREAPRWRRLVRTAGGQTACGFDRRQAG